MLTKALKTSTSGAHKSLENSAFMRPLHTGTIDLTYYQLLLKKFYGIFYPLEAAVNRHHEVLQYWLPDLQQRRKAATIEEDLMLLGAQTIDIPFLKIEGINTPAAALGAMYVMEGSTLGGRFIAKTIQKRLDLSSAQGVQFFHGYGQETGPMWQQFQQALLDFEVGHSEAVPEVIAAANYVFKEFELWIN